MKYHFKIHKEDKGFWAECVELEGCHTQGETMEELEFNMKEVLDLVLSEPPDSKYILKYPKKTKRKDEVEVSPSPEVAMAMILRQFRLENGFTQHQMREALGIKHISQYQRLEDPIKSNPQLKTLFKVKTVFPNFPIEMIFG